VVFIDGRSRLSPVATSRSKVITSHRAGYIHYNCHGPEVTDSTRGSCIRRYYLSCPSFRYFVLVLRQDRSHADPACLAKHASTSSYT
jgi:hypothetical protein